MKRIFDDREKKKIDRESSKKKMKLPEEWEEQYIRRQSGRSRIFSRMRIQIMKRLTRGRRNRDTRISCTA